MHLRTANGELSLKLLHATPAQSPSQPDLHVEVSATVQAYSAHGVRAWLEWPDVEAFIAELAVVVREVKGEAKLYAMSPEDFGLVVASLDSRGHFGINFAVGSRLHTDNGQFQCDLRGGLEVELSQVEALLQWFHAVIGRTEA
ncbi:MAG: hypothetical protein Q8K96_09790 [Rubrivivax sp.]|nr:hypothetical protein [Rubrivivax sp.]